MNAYQWSTYWAGDNGPIGLIVLLSLATLLLVWVLAGEINESFEDGDNDN